MDWAYHLMLNDGNCDVELSESCRIIQAIIICFPEGKQIFIFSTNFKLVVGPTHPPFQRLLGLIACGKIDSPSASYLKSETRTCPVTCSISYYTGLGDEKTTAGNKKRC